MAGVLLRQSRGDHLAGKVNLLRGRRPATFGGVRCSQGMNTFGKILLFTLLALVAIHLFPILLLPIILAVAAMLVIGTMLAGGFAALAATGLSLVAVVIAVVLVALAVLSPIWLPLLAIYGLVKLCGRNGKVAA
jgi:hypothetical protein